MAEFSWFSTYDKMTRKRVMNLYLHLLKEFLDGIALVHTLDIDK